MVADYNSRGPISCYNRHAMPADTTTLVIFGASGDLTRNKLIPALFGLWRKERLPAGFHLVGMSRSVPPTEAFCADIRQAAMDGSDDDRPAWDAFASRIETLQGDPTTAEALSRLNAHLAGAETAQGATSNRLYYLATPPHVYTGVITSMGQVGLLDRGQGWRRVVIEKPFGSNLASAQELNRVVHAALDEDQVYRIDHYLGKETVQNLLVFRFANSIFEPLWNRRYIDHVQITVSETVGVEQRGDFYDRVGVLRDMFQNHLMQILSFVAMEPPASFSADALRDERSKVLRSVRPIEHAAVLSETVRAQYEGYLQEPGVAANSTTPTYAALRLNIDNWRWQGVPFYVRSGKHMAVKSTGVLIQFKSVPHLMFPLPPGEAIRPNALELCLQPDEGMHLVFEVKVPDTSIAMRSVDMDFHYADDFGPEAIPDAYERLLLDALMGDASLFTRADTIELAWTLVDPIQQAWDQAGAARLARYPQGSWGPPEADALLAQDGRGWSRSCVSHPDSPRHLRLLQAR
jgi:glucose-6-phosphate 1-dehydrogenase